MRFGFFVLTLRMVVRCLMVVMGSGLMCGSGIVMMLASRMFSRLSHLVDIPFEVIKQIVGVKLARGHSGRTSIPATSQDSTRKVLTTPPLLVFINW